MNWAILCDVSSGPGGGMNWMQGLGAVGSVIAACGWLMILAIIWHWKEWVGGIFIALTVLALVFLAGAAGLFN